MHIIFTDKLSKMVAQYENLLDIFDLNTSFDINTSWDQDTLERKVFSIMGKPTGRKNPERT